MAKIKVSIIIPVYNGSDYMAQAIDCALAQNWRPLEIIVVNDGSDDQGATDTIARSYGNRIMYICHQENQGGSAAVNTGIRAMTGNYFSWLSHDDLYTPDKIPAQLEVVRSFEGPRLPVVYSNWIQIDGEGKELKKIQVPAVSPEKMPLFLFADRSLHGCSLLIPKEAFDTVGYFDPKLKGLADYDFFMRLCLEYPFVPCDEFLVMGRAHKNQFTHRYKDFQREREWFNLKYLSMIDFSGLIQLPSAAQITYVHKVASYMIHHGCVKSLAAWTERLAKLLPPSTESGDDGARSLLLLSLLYTIATADKTKTGDLANALTIGIHEILPAKPTPEL